MASMLVLAVPRSSDALARGRGTGRIEVMTTTLITGANRGLGLETARRLIDVGHTVYAGMRDVGGGDAARELGAIPVALDVTDQDSVDAAIAALPALDVLVNNAGILGASRRGLDDLDATAMHQTLETNVLGLVRVTQAALPLLRRSASPVIVNVASGVGWPRWLSTPGHDEHPVLAIPYAASKAAVIALTVQYAKNLPGFRVNVSDPGYTATEFNGYSGHQTLREGTDATVHLATIGPDGPTGEFHNRTGRIAY
jgi:NAD(P)-dependent dehydrogenase (short-subunit alcohol dehydrogenase family)